MPSAQLASFIEEVNNNTELRQELQSNGANPIEIANRIGYRIDPSDLGALKIAVNIWENSSTDLRTFLQLVSQNPDLQTRLQQPGEDLIQIAGELGIKLDREEFESVSRQLVTPDVIELDDEALSQVTGGVVLEAAATALVSGVMFNMVIPMINAAMVIVAAGAVVGTVAAVGAVGGIAYSALKD